MMDIWAREAGRRICMYRPTLFKRLQMGPIFILPFLPREWIPCFLLLILATRMYLSMSTGEPHVSIRMGSCINRFAEAAAILLIPIRTLLQRSEPGAG